MRRRAQMAVEHHADRASVREPRQAAGELGSSASTVPTPTMIASERARKSCVWALAMAPVMRSGALSARGREAIRRHGELERDLWPPLRDAQDMARMQARGIAALEDAGDDLDAGVAQLVEALAADARVGIFEAADDSRHARRDHGLGARRRAP